MNLFDQFFDQPLDGPDAEAVTEPAALLHTVVIDDRQLVALDRSRDRPVAVTVINSTGAGGITALAGRTLTNCRLAAVQNTVRDPGDPIGAIARIAAAARELDPEVTVLVDIPDGYGFQDAVAAAEAEGLTAYTGQAAADRLATRLSGFVEADLPFVVDGVDSAAAVIGLLAAVDSLIDDGDGDRARDLLAGTDHDQQAAAITGWDDSRMGRVRRRLRAIRTRSLPAVLSDLDDLGLGH
ncbi:MAG: hypothetical protein J2P23_09525 [Microlunatus sp.]|nr:hypothetical protein [Microlunatus sp.]